MVKASWFRGWVCSLLCALRLTKINPAGSPGRPTCVCVTAVSAFTWLRRSRRPSFPPESSCSVGEGRSSRRLASSSDSFASSTVRRLRRGLLAVPLLLAVCSFSAPVALAQTPNVFWSSMNFQVSEGEVVNLEFQVTENLTTNLSVNYSLGGSATCGTDYMITGAVCASMNGTLTAPSGTASFDGINFPITFVDDGSGDDDETVVITFTSGTGYGFGTPVDVTLTIKENGGPAAFEIRGTSQVGETLMVVRTSDDPDGNGTGTPTYRWLSRFPNAMTWSLLQIGMSDRYTLTATEEGKLVYVAGTYEDGVGFVDSFETEVLGPIRALPLCTNCVWITGGSNITEGGDAVFTVHANPAPSADLTVPLWVFDAGGHSDFLYGKYEGSEKVTIMVGHNSAMHTVPTYDDVYDEADGDVVVKISSGRAGGRTYWRHDPDTASVTVRDDDASITAHDPPDAYASVSGSAVTATKTVANNTTGEQVCFGIAGGAYPTPHVSRFKVNYRMRAGTREWWRSYVWLGRDAPFGTRACLELRTLTARCGNTATYTFEVLEGGQSATRDNVTRQDVTLDHYDISTSNPTATFTVTGDTCPMRSEQVLPGGTPSEVTVAADRTSVTEGGDVTFTVTASPAPAHDLVVDVSATEEMGAGADRKAVAHLQTVTIPAGLSSATWTLTTMSDETALADGTVEFRAFADPAGLYTLGTPSEVTVALLDDDGVVPQDVPDSVVGDPATPAIDPELVAEVRVRAAETKHGATHVKRWRRVLVAFGVETYAGLTPTTAAEAKANAKRYSSPLWPRIATVLTALEAAAALAEQEEQQPETVPGITVSAGDAVTEGGDATFTVTASPAPAAPLSVSVTVAAEGDFGITIGERPVTIPTTGSAVLTLATTGDDADEPDGSATVTVNAGEGYTVGSPASGTVSIADDDAPLPAITVSVGDAVTEGGDATFTVTASPAPASPLAVSVTVAAEGDFGLTSGTRTVSIPTAGSVTLTLATSGDDADEPDGSASVTVNAGDGYTVGSPASGTVAVRDDDLPPPAVSITAKTASVTEGGSAVFTLTADRAPDADLTVTLAVAETGGGDHVAAADEGPATAVIAKGATEAVFSVATVDDDANEPDGSVTVTLKDGGGYTVPLPPGNAATATISDDDAAVGPALTVEDATGKENGRLPVMPFTVRLSAPSQAPVRVYVSTRPSTPVSATPKVDYAPGSYDLLFRAGETEKQVWIWIYDDSHDEEPETFEVVLSKAQGAGIGDGVAVGTIVNDDPMPAAWLARFGRTVAEQALDGIAGRMAADRTPGMQGAIAGQALSFDPAANDNGSAAPGHMAAGSPAFGGTGALAEVAQAFGGHAGRHGAGGIAHDATGFGSVSPGSLSGAGGAGFTQSQTMTARDALLGSGFSLTGAADGSGGSMAFWGRAAQGSFDGREGAFSLDGTVTTGMLGADYARGKWLVGLALARSEGEGDYRDSDVSPRPDGQTCPDGVDNGLCSGAVRAGDGSVEASLTAAIPYAALQASERLKLWGAVGYGTGEVTLKTAMGGSYSSDTTWSMTAAGLRGDLLAPPTPGSGSGAGSGSGPALAVTSDALWTRTSSEKTRDLAASDSDATRLRLGLEGSYRMALEGGGNVTPKLEVGARHDGGDAETGFGVDLGGGIAWTDPALGLSLDVSGRTLIAHGNDDLKDRGYAASLAFDPDPATGRGPSLSLRQEFGGQANGGLDALFQPATLEDRTGGEVTSRWSMEAAYGLPAFGGRFTGSPHVGLGLATGGRDYSAGWRLTPEATNAPGLSFGLRATRRESDAQVPEHSIGVEITATW